MKVLLVDDDPEAQLIARAALKRAGLIVRTASDGAEALEAVRVEAPDVILLDWMMPDLDGPEVCRRLKADPSTSSIPIVFLSARSQQAELARSVALGAAGYIIKPFDAVTLGDEIRALIGVK